MSQDQPKVIWQADSTHPQLAETAREYLRQVIDPEIGLNVIELGLVRDLQIEEGQAQMMMIMTTPFCPYGPALLEMARKKAEEAVNRPTTIELGMEMWEPSMMEDEAGAAWGFF
jgi:metal-sulfur cluster biosynthetic enzyme